MPITIQCLRCGQEVSALRRNRKKFCSATCASRFRSDRPTERKCRYCDKPFAIITRGDGNRQHCSRACAKAHNTKRINTWHAENPGAMAGYNKTRLAKDPGAYRDKARRDRLESIRLLGGACVVCGATNPNWLHVDYIPTNKASPYRHPRHLSFVRRHLSDFRLLCANHHYELTLTGKIEGTEITQ